ncbi:MAG: hypothetical protein ACI8ZB_002910 [Desulforhopalus sp.]|jgi:hypothetical protein
MPYHSFPFQFADRRVGCACFTIIKVLLYGYVVRASNPNLKTYTMRFLYKFSIDVFCQSYISGWIFHRFNTGKSLHIVFKEGDTVLGECSTSLSREDVKSKDIHPTGLCGFSFSLPASYAESEKRGEITLTIRESGVILCKLDPQYMGQIVQVKTQFWHRFKQRSQQNKDTIFFMHIPKTAGTSFNSFAGSLYKPDEIITHIEAFDQTSYPEIAERYRFISGHLRMDTIKMFFSGPDIQLYTLIREPYGQLHSHLNWLRGIGADRGSAFYQAHHGLFKDLADDFGDKTELNHQTLQNIVDNISGVLKKLVDNNQSRHFLTGDPTTVTNKDFAEIRDNVKLFTMVGTTKEYSLFQKDFCEMNSFPPPAAVKSLNSSRFTQLYDHTDPVTREIVTPLVAFDLQLYALARQS